MKKQRIITLNRKKNHDASITVFLSLVLLLILSLVMTVIEGTRQKTAMVFTERALITAMDSVLAGYYGPLMDEYHIFGLNLPYEEDLDKHDEISLRIQDYMSYTLNPGHGISGAGNSLYLFSNTLESVEVINSTGLLDYQGEIFINEVIEYMKYRSIGNVIEFFMDKASLLEQPGKISVLYEEKAELEEKLVAIDEAILALMKHIDGISTGRKGLIRAAGGKLKTEESFVKKILYGPVTMESVGINNEVVFLALKDNYIDPSEGFDIIADSFIRLDTVLETIEVLENRLAINRQTVKEEQKAIEKLQEIPANSSETVDDYEETINKHILEIKDRISALDDEAENISSDIGSYMAEKKKLIDTINSYGKNIYNLVSNCLASAEQALNKLEIIISTAEDAEPLIRSYEENLNNKKSELEVQIYDSLQEEFNEIKKYLIDNSNGYDFIRMKDILTVNCSVLSSCLDSLNHGYEAMSTENYSRAKASFSCASNELPAYKTQGLNIDYSTLTAKEEDTPDYIEGMKDLIGKGIVSLVMDSDIISDKKITNERLPSDVEMILEEKEGFSFSKLLKNMTIGAKESKTGDLFGSFGDYSLGSLIGNGADEILERVLVLEYIKEHFYRFPTIDDETEGRKPSALTYEMEYLLFGKTSDRGNLEAVIGRLLLIRTLLNFTTILACKEKWKEAKVIATSLVGFTGLPILVAITQGILMILLALASALIDVCALLTGKELPIIKKDIDLEYIDILLLTRENIRKKAASYNDEKGFSYNDYLILFLCLTNQRKLSYRMMDLVQENVNIRYETDISLQNCVFGYEAKVKYSIKPIFTSFTFMNKFINTGNSESHIITAECSY